MATLRVKGTETWDGSALPDEPYNYTRRSELCCSQLRRQLSTQSGTTNIIVADCSVASIYKLPINLSPYNRPTIVCASQAETEIRSTRTTRNWFPLKPKSLKSSVEATTVKMTPSPNHRLCTPMPINKGPSLSRDFEGKPGCCTIHSPAPKRPWRLRVWSMDTRNGAKTGRGGLFAGWLTKRGPKWEEN